MMKVVDDWVVYETTIDTLTSEECNRLTLHSSTSFSGVLGSTELAHGVPAVPVFTFLRLLVELFARLALPAPCACLLQPPRPLEP